MARRRRWINTVPGEVGAHMAGSAPMVLDELADRERRVDRLLHEAVYVARSRGWTWQQIADSLGVSKSAAHQRFAGDDPDAERWAPMDERAAAGSGPGLRAVG